VGSSVGACVRACVRVCVCVCVCACVCVHPKLKKDMKRCWYRKYEGSSKEGSKVLHQCYGRAIAVSLESMCVCVRGCVRVFVCVCLYMCSCMSEVYDHNARVLRRGDRRVRGKSQKTPVTL
jgi:hypothetical protein